MTFRMWTPGRAAGVDKNIHPSSACEKCNGTGEEQYKYVSGCGFSHIVCTKCGGLGMKKKKEEKVDSGTTT